MINVEQTAIKSFGISVAGKSHLERNLGCQDACRYLELANNWSAALIADGVGSKRNAEAGAKKAVAAAAEFLLQHPLPTWAEDNIIALLRMAFATALHAVSLLAADENADWSDYDSTLTIAIYNGRYFGFGHCGDGGIIAMDMAGTLFVPTQRQKGESFNTVSPLRNHGQWSFDCSPEPVKAVMLMTDGLFDYAQVPWMQEPDPGLCFQLLQPVSLLEKSVDELNAELVTILTAPPFSGIGDDMTAAVMVNTQIPASEYSEYDVLDYRQRKEEIVQLLRQKQEDEQEQGQLRPEDEVNPKGVDSDSRVEKNGRLFRFWRPIVRWWR